MTALRQSFAQALRAQAEESLRQMEACGETQTGCTREECLIQDGVFALVQAAEVLLVVVRCVATAQATQAEASSSSEAWEERCHAAEAQVALMQTELAAAQQHAADVAETQSAAAAAVSEHEAERERLLGEMTEMRDQLQSVRDLQAKTEADKDRLLKKLQQLVQRCDTRCACMLVSWQRWKQWRRRRFCRLGALHVVLQRLDTCAWWTRVRPPTRYRALQGRVKECQVCVCVRCANVVGVVMVCA